MPTIVPAPSFIPNRPTSPVPDVSALFRAARICTPVRAMFQMRPSSRSPAKNPAAAPVEVSAEPIAACWIESDLGVAATASFVQGV